MQNMIDSIRQAETEAEVMERNTAAECAKILADAKEEAKNLILRTVKECTAHSEARLAAAAAEKERCEALADRDAVALKEKLSGEAGAKESQAIDHILSRIF